MTRDCFEPEASFLVLRSLAARCEGFAAGAGIADDAESCFFIDRDIEILRSVQGGVAPHHRSPASAIEPAGQDPGACQRPGTDRSTALFEEEGQSFLDNFIACLGNSEHLEPLTLNQRVPGSSPGAPTNKSGDKAVLFRDAVPDL